MNHYQIFTSKVCLLSPGLSSHCLFQGFCVLSGCSSLWGQVLCSAKHYQWKLMRIRSERSDPHRLIEFSFLLPSEEFEVGRCICSIHQIEEFCCLSKLPCPVHCYKFIDVIETFLWPCFSVQKDQQRGPGISKTPYYCSTGAGRSTCLWSN